MVKIWKKLIINREHGVIIVNIPVSFFIFSGFDPNKKYQYRLRPDPSRRRIIIELRRMKEEESK